MQQEMLNSMKKNAEENGYFICPDQPLLHDLIDGLVTNTKRYGYGSCPCRVACGVKINDADIICPCEYRDADVNEHGMCYCGLFVNKEIKDNPSKMGPIPERRPQEITDAALVAAETKQHNKTQQTKTVPSSQKDKTIKVWRCTVCGYLCARDLPPAVCPICKAKAERFTEFDIR